MATLVAYQKSLKARAIKCTVTKSQLSELLSVRWLTYLPYYSLDGVPPKFNFFLQWANLIGPSLKKKEIMEIPQGRRFYFEV
jgi:hypothetical protein